MDSKKSKLDPIYELFDLLYQDITNLKIDPIVHVLFPLIMLLLSGITSIYLLEEYKSAKLKKTS